MREGDSNPISPEVQWLGPLSGNSGYAIEGELLVEAVRSAGLAVTPFDVPQPADFKEIEAVKKLLRSGAYVCDHAAVAVHHRAWADTPLDAKKFNIWRTMFETAAIPRSWVEAIADYDAVWVPGNFNRATFIAAGVPDEKLHVVSEPLPSTTEKLISAITSRRTSARKFVFLSVFRWQDRKGWRILLEAFARQYEFSRDVELRLKVNAYSENSDSVQEQVDRFFRARGSATPSNVQLVVEDLSDDEMVNLYIEADAFVLPSHGEGWGRPYMEAVLSGLPVIASGWGGCLDFLTCGTASFVEGSLGPTGELATEEWPYFEEQMWFHPDIADLASCMARVRSQSPSASAKESAANDLVQRFSPQEIRKQVIAGLSGHQWQDYGRT